ncbi:VOC family protein [Humibacillus xanthopallidus]|uniref:Glyoxalase/bleomycin resistance protein/dioxygenase superfamily protein n=1 Tax=Humibacillus xanthopallidus TaxID=412689 RepID=A0A543I1C1_9MICO|nr:VOC family protein [Humibacillus xanthopallidus]TQM64300.1 glyoxalase/bleomycin resistance protein/dioxygenase superfamily protein [Humibacillus xanthopallidus]
MITAVHNLVYSDDAAATRAFFRDVLQWPFVADDGSTDRATDDGGDSETGGGGTDAWLIFATGPSEVGVHPTRGPGASSWTTPRHHEISLMCDDLRTTMSELASRGASFTGEPVDRGFGLCIMLAVPGADDVMLYEPRHATAFDR